MNSYSFQGARAEVKREARIIRMPHGAKRQGDSGKGCYYKIALPLENGIRFLDPRKIAYCEAQGNYTNIVLFNGDAILISKTLKWLEMRLSEQEFFRSHGSYIVALNSISFLGKSTAQLENGFEVAVSRRRRDALLERLQ